MRMLMRVLSTRRGASDPHGAFAALREAGALHNVPFFGPAFTRYDDVRRTLFDRALLVSSQAAKPGSARAEIARRLPADLRRLPAPLFFLDGPEHRRLRQAIAPAFRQRAIEDLRPQITAITHALIDVSERRPTFDLVAEFAAPLPLLVIAAMLGVPPGQHRQFRLWSEKIIAELHALAGEEELSAAIDAHRGLAECFRSEIEQRRRRPGGDLISMLVDASRVGIVLSEDEIVSLCINILVAGHITTADLIASLCCLVLTHPQQRARLTREPTLWANAVEEALRLEPPTPLLARICPAAAEFSGRRFAAGDNLNLFIASANRDPRAFKDPNRFDLDRERNPHLSFGGGNHFCLGAGLARAEASIAAQTLFARLPKLALVADGAQWRRNANFRGLARLQVTTSSAQAKHEATHEPIPGPIHAPEDRAPALA
jgi:cytochrome P450